MTFDVATVYFVILLSSVKAGDFAEKKWPDDSAYMISKMADTMLARALNHEFSKHAERDIVINAVRL